MRPQLDFNNPLLAALQREPAPWLRAAVMQRDNYICQYCRIAPATEIDHVKPWDQGGLTVISNLVAACEHCNREKGNRTPLEWEMAKQRAAQVTALKKLAAYGPPLKVVRQIPPRKVRRIPGHRPCLADLLRASE